MTRENGTMSIAMIGTRGVPANYGGFETAVEEIGARLVQRGHHVRVYCRSTPTEQLSNWRGMELVHLPALRLRSAETLSHTALSVAHLARQRQRPDAALVFNAANSPFVPFLGLLRVPTAVHVDGLEWMREKWSGLGRRYYLFAERFAVRHAQALIADAPGIADYYREKFGAETELLSYGTRIISEPPATLITRMGLAPKAFHLVVARFEPENHVDVIVEAYRRSTARLPLVVVGSAPYAARHTAAISSAAAADPRIRLFGGVWDQDLLDELYANTLTYLHGHSVGGTNPSLLRAMGAAAAVLAWDVGFNRDAAGPGADYFDNPATLASQIENAEQRAARTVDQGRQLQTRAAANYDWDDVAAGYERLVRELVAGASRTITTHPTAVPRHDTELRPS